MDMSGAAGFAGAGFAGVSAPPGVAVEDLFVRRIELNSELPRPTYEDQPAKTNQCSGSRTRIVSADLPANVRIEGPLANSRCCWSFLFTFAFHDRRRLAGDCDHRGAAAE